MSEVSVLLTIAAARINCGMSQAEVAKALNMSTKTYIGYEKYRRVFRTDRAWDFSRIVNQPFDRIIFLPSDYELLVQKTANG